MNDLFKLTEKFFYDELLPLNLNVSTTPNYPRSNVTDNKDNWKVSVVAPGLTKKDFTISLENNKFTVSYDLDKETNNRYISKSYNKTWEVPSGVDASTISAKYNAGILDITINKPDAVKPSLIKVN